MSQTRQRGAHPERIVFASSGILKILKRQVTNLIYRRNCSQWRRFATETRAVFKILSRNSLKAGIRNVEIEAGQRSRVLSIETLVHAALHHTVVLFLNGSAVVFFFVGKLQEDRLPAGVVESLGIVTEKSIGLDFHLHGQL